MSMGESSHVTITHDALDLTIQRFSPSPSPNPAGHETSLHKDLPVLVKVAEFPKLALIHGILLSLFI